MNIRFVWDVSNFLASRFMQSAVSIALWFRSVWAFCDVQILLSECKSDDLCSLFTRRPSNGAAIERSRICGC
jgi:hypothetical protein